MHNQADQWMARLNAETAKIAALPAGSLYTLAFLGIRSGLDQAENTFTAQALPSYSGLFELGQLDFSPAGNASLLPNDNGILQAFVAAPNRRQARMAVALARLALARGLRLQVITHSNGVNGAAHFLSTMPVARALENVVVIAPNTASARKIRQLAEASSRLTVLTSSADSRLKLAPLSRRAPRRWAAVLGGLATACVLATVQSGHGAQHYLAEVLAGRACQL